MDKLNEINLPYLYIVFQAVVIFLVSFISQEIDNAEKSTTERLMQSIAVTIIATPIVLALFVLLNRKYGLV